MLLQSTDQSKYQERIAKIKKDLEKIQVLFGIYNYQLPDV